MNLGIIHGEAADVYHNSGAVGSHALGDFESSALLFQRLYVTREIEKPAPTAALAFGLYFHTACLEGDAAVAARFAVSEKFDRRTKAGKEAAAAFEAANAGKQVVDTEDRDLAECMLVSVRAKNTCRDLFARGKPEVTFRADMGPFAVQCRADWYDDQRDEWHRPRFVDLKTIESLADFPRQFVNLGYYRQVAFYQLVIAEVLKLSGAYPRALMVVVEKSEPFDCAVFEPDEEALDHGRKEALALLKRLKACYLSGEWPGQPDSVQLISLPPWKIAKGVTA